MFYISSDNIWPIRCFHTERQEVYHNITSYIIIQVISTFLVNSYSIQLICLFWEVLGRLGCAAMLGRSQQLGLQRINFQSLLQDCSKSISSHYSRTAANQFPVTTPGQQRINLQSLLLGCSKSISITTQGLQQIIF